MAFDDVVTVLVVLVPVGLALGGFVIHYLLRTESRLTRVETKLDGVSQQVGAIVKHLGLNPGRPEEEKKP